MNPSEDNRDSNANVGKGAIPKTKPLKPKKTNNNIDFGDLNGFSSYYYDSDDDQLNKGCPRETDEKPALDDLLIRNDDNLSDSGSASEENELLSMSDDGCIYTYKGDQLADLPSSFFNLDLPPIDKNPAPPPPEDSREDNSSPEMDFLEMDFDPGPSGDADSDSISNTEMENAANLPLDKTAIEEEQTVVVEEEEPKPCCSKDLDKDDKKAEKNYLKLLPIDEQKNIAENKIVASEVRMPWSCMVHDRTRSSKQLRVIKRHTKGELLTPEMEHIQMGNNAGNKARVMIWTEQEASFKQITPLGPSSCGAAAVLNVLNALRLPIPSNEKVAEFMPIKLRENASPLPQYLRSRSRAGCTHRDIIAGLYNLSNGVIYARFFHMYPERIVNLHKWLTYWLKNGAVPIVTLNLQRSGSEDGVLPDSWHHQMIYGCDSRGCYLTNPNEYVDYTQLFPQLTSDSVLLIRNVDVVSRWNARNDLQELMNISDVRWKDLNVVGQVAKIIRDSRRNVLLPDLTARLKIPAEYKAGVTLAVDINSTAFALLCQCPELPLLHTLDAASAF